MRPPARFLPILVASLAAGCAHDRGQYAYAPPLAPPVYPQPAGYATPQVAATPLPSPVAPVAAIGVPPQEGIPVAAVSTPGVDPCVGVMTAAGGVVEAPCGQEVGVIMADGGVVYDGDIPADCGPTSFPE